MGIEIYFKIFTLWKFSYKQGLTTFNTFFIKLNQNLPKQIRSSHNRLWTK